MAEIDKMDTHSGNGLSENVLDTSVKRQTSILPVDDGDVLLDYEAEEPDDVENLAKDSDNENADLEADSNKLDGKSFNYFQKFHLLFLPILETLKHYTF